MRKLLSTAIIAGLSCMTLLSSPAMAEYPEKPVSFVVPFPPGDLEDVLTRMIADDMQSTYGQPAAVINKPGGGGGPFPGAVEVAKAPADGYTVGSFVVGVPVVGPNIGIPELSPDPFDPLGIFLTYPFVIAASKDAPYKTMQELAEYAKKEKVILGHFGDPLAPTQVTKALAKKMGFAYASDAAFDALDCNTIASGDVDVMNTTLQLIKPCLDKMTVLATVTGERIPALPDTPTVGEIEPSLKMSLWNGLFVRKDTPDDVRQKIIEVATKTMSSDRAKKLAEETGAQIYWQDSAASKAQIESDINTMAEIKKIMQ
ncbi:MAG: tripartite tricarboxylate transporter substrate binding protein [Thiolinea sp.]